MIAVIGLYPVDTLASLLPSVFAVVVATVNGVPFTVKGNNTL